MQWQTIDTAPKDGRHVLLFGAKPDVYYNDEASFPAIVVAWWETEYEPHWRFCSYDSGVYGEISTPTHWMPLPPPPNTSAA